MDPSLFSFCLKWDIYWRWDYFTQKGSHFAYLVLQEYVYWSIVPKRVVSERITLSFEKACIWTGVMAQGVNFTESHAVVFGEKSGLIDVIGSFGLGFVILSPVFGVQQNF